MSGDDRRTAGPEDSTIGPDNRTERPKNGTGGNSAGGDGHRTGAFSRRRLLALAGAGAAGLAGCSGGDGAGTDGPTATDSATATATSEPTAAATSASTPSATPTATDTATDSATATRSVQEKMARYGCPALEKDGDYDIVVAQDGSGDYETVQAAIDNIPQSFEETRVFIESGRYKEKLEIPSNRTDVTFVGEDPEETVLTYDDHEAMEDLPGSSASVMVWGPDFTAVDVTFENAAEPVAQALAIEVNGDRAAFFNCRFLGHQDTVYTREKTSRQYYRDCYIEGDVDFIYGGATAYFDGCEIFCKDQGYITASSTPEDNEFGHVLVDCQVHGDAGENTVYLGRPWEPYAQTVYLNCELGDVIRPEGWEPWVEENHPDKTETAFYAEYNNSGPGYTPDQRVEWSRQLSDEEAEPYLDVETVFDGWDPAACL